MLLAIGLNGPAHRRKLIEVKDVTIALMFLLKTPGIFRAKLIAPEPN